MANATESTAASGGDLSPRVAALRHPLYDLLKQLWIDLANVREGIGGFLDGTYLRAHPREYLDHTVSTTDATTGITVTRANPNPKSPSPKLLTRRLLARYENVASSIVSAMKALLFKDAPTRRLEGKQGEPENASPIEQWWEDVDGNGTPITDAVRAWWDLAATFGHVVLYFCKDTVPDATTAADQPMPYVRVYTPIDNLNWLTDDNGNITAIKVMEAIPPSDFDDVWTTKYAVRVIDQQQSALYQYNVVNERVRAGTGKRIGEPSPHGLGRLPVVYLFAKRRGILSDVGESVLGDPKNYIDLYNLTSEIRELLRNQTFSFINLPLGSGQDAMTVEAAQAMMGKQTGTMNVLFSAQPAQILTGDSSNVEVYHAEIERTKREIYRETGVQWDADAKGVEAQGSLEIKREEMTTRIGQYADECQKAEYQLAELFYRSYYGETWETQWETDRVTIHYNSEIHDPKDEDVLKRAQAAQSLGYPPEVMKAIKKQALRSLIAADAPESLLTELDTAIDNAEEEPTQREQLQMKLQAQAKRVAA